MADSEQVLTQEQIDAMLAGGTVEQASPAEAPVQQASHAEGPPENPVTVTPTTIDEVRAQEAEAPSPAPAPLPPATPPAAPTVAPPVAAVDSGVLQGSIDQLSQRLAQLESSMQQTEQLRAEFQAWVGQLQTITATVESLMASLQGTVGYGAHESFICSSCQSQGNVAAKPNWALWTGGAVLLGAVAMGLQAQSLNDDAHSKADQAQANGDAALFAEAQGDLDDSKQAANIANALLVIGGGLLVYYWIAGEAPAIAAVAEPYPAVADAPLTLDFRPHAVRVAWRLSW